MASRRKLKREIDAITTMIIIDSLNCLSVDKNKQSSEEVINIINKSIALRDELIARISHVDAKNDCKKVKAYFAALRQDLNKGVEENFVNLSNIVSSH